MRNSTPPTPPTGAEGFQATLGELGVEVWDALCRECGLELSGSIFEVRSKKGFREAVRDTGLYVPRMYVHDFCLGDLQNGYPGDDFDRDTVVERVNTVRVLVVREYSENHA